MEDILTEYKKALLKLELDRDYQQKAQLDVYSKWKREDVAVLGMSPSGGKTRVALNFALKVLAAKGKVLILAHGTNILKNQWSQELNKLGISYSNNINEGNLVVTIPQSINLATLNRKFFNLLIVDEGHEFYFAPSGVNIRKTIKFEKQLILTGTPSIFRRNGFKPIIVPGTEVYKAGFLTDAYIGLVKSKYGISSCDYNTNKELISAKMLTKEETEGTLDAVIEEMLSRLTMNKIKDKPDIVSTLGLTLKNKVKKITFLFKELDKTMIAARSIDQANHISSYLLNHNVKSVISTSESDTDSTKIEDFKNDPEIRVLITVKRGILGFNMPELVNVVDFSCTRNIDRIYQLYARVLRLHPEGRKKYFFRVVSKINPSVDSFYTQAALCLNSKKFAERYNGKNLRSLEVLVLKKKNPLRVGEEKKEWFGKKKSQNGKKYNIDQDFYNSIMGLELMSEITVNSKSSIWNEYEYAKFGDVINKLEKHDAPKIEDMREDIVTSLENGWYFDDGQNYEMRHQNVKVYTDPRHPQYDEYFTSVIKKYHPYLLIHNPDLIHLAVADVVKQANPELWVPDAWYKIGNSLDHLYLSEDASDIGDLILQRLDTLSDEFDKNLYDKVAEALGSPEAIEKVIFPRYERMIDKFESIGLLDDEGIHAWASDFQLGNSIHDQRSYKASIFKYFSPFSDFDWTRFECQKGPKGRVSVMEFCKKHYTHFREEYLQYARETAKEINKLGWGGVVKKNGHYSKAAYFITGIFNDGYIIEELILELGDNLNRAELKKIGKLSETYDELKEKHNQKSFFRAA